MAIAPLIGGWLNNKFGWKSIFYSITFLSTISLTTIFLFFKDTLLKENRKCLNTKSIVVNYKNITIQKKFVTNLLVCALMYGSIMIYISNLPLIFIDFLGVSKSSFGYYQAFTMSRYVIFQYSLR